MKKGLIVAVILLSYIIGNLYISERETFRVKPDEVTCRGIIMPAQFQSPILEALKHYPDLSDAHIKFELIGDGTPLVSRPTVYSTLFRKAEDRRYLIQIATSSSIGLDSILLEAMPHEAQVGVLGHELAHTDDFFERNTWQMLRVAVGNLSPQFLDNFERQTDMRAIRHGLGCQLLAWSVWVRSAVDLENHEKENIRAMEKNERYLHPTSILNTMKTIGHPTCSAQERPRKYRGRQIAENELDSSSVFRK